MEIRSATSSDVAAVRDLARASLTASYAPALDGDTIEAAVEGWYSEDAVSTAVAEDRTVMLLATDGADVVGFAKGVVVGRREPVGEIHWLHVHPDSRGQGIGTDLLDRIESELADYGAERFAGFTLAVNEEGAAFYEHHGYERANSREVEVGAECFDELEYQRGRDDGLEAAGSVPSEVLVDGETRYVGADEAERGSVAPFYPLYSDPERASQYAYLCGNCESTDVAVDSMDRYECNVCENRRKPARWDAAYL
jgi:ribosomal protein S18 acetylase RimI-like enzyme